jgi:hypothetical protein
MTKAEFISAYRNALVKRYDWAANDAKLDRFMDNVSDTIHTPQSAWNHDGEAVTEAWRSIGGKGKPTLKALRGLA